MIRLGHRRFVVGSAALSLAMTFLMGCGSSGQSAPTTTKVPVSTTSTLPGVRPSKGCTAPTGAPSTTAADAGSITVAGTSRSFVVSDTGAEHDTPAPVVVLLHGMGQSATVINRYSDFPARAAKAGVILVTPDASGSPSMWQPSASGPDAALITALLDEIEATHCVDTAREYLVGFSVGAVMAATYACANPGRIAAIAALSVQFPAGCTRPLSIIGFHGTADPIVPYAAGAEGAIGGGAGTEANMAKWALNARCGAKPSEQVVTPKVTRLRWNGCAQGAAVELYRTDGGAHVWPGSTTDPSVAVHGDDAVAATEVILGFFARHHLAG